MATRVLIQQGLIRVSKPGQDVYTAAERDLLLSLSARNCQIIQRGYVDFPPGSSPGADGFLSVANFGVGVGFPAQQSTPDVWVALVPRGGGNNDADNFILYKGAYTLNFGTDSFTCTGRWQYTTASITSVFALIYVVFRKRLT